MNDVDWMGLVNESKKLGPNAVKDQLSFKGVTVLVTGSGGGLGRAYALMFGALGANVVVNDLNENAANKVVDAITQKGGIAIANYDNVLHADTMISKIIEEFGRIDVVVNNAGILRDRSFAKMKSEDWDSVLTVHLKGTYLVTKAAWPHMLNQKYGRIINTSSAVGLYGNFGQANYSAAKAAIIAFSASICTRGKETQYIGQHNSTKRRNSNDCNHITQGNRGSVKARLRGSIRWISWHTRQTQSRVPCLKWVLDGLPRFVGKEVRECLCRRPELKVKDVEEAWPTICDFSRANQYPKTPEESFKTIIKSLNSSKDGHFPKINQLFLHIQGCDHLSFGHWI